MEEHIVHTVLLSILALLSVQGMAMNAVLVKMSETAAKNLGVPIPRSISIMFLISFICAVIVWGLVGYTLWTTVSPVAILSAIPVLMINKRAVASSVKKFKAMESQNDAGHSIIGNAFVGLLSVLLCLIGAFAFLAWV